MSAERGRDEKKKSGRQKAGRREGRPARWADAHVPLLAICLALTRIGFVGEKIISAFGWDSRYLQVGVGVGVSDVSGECDTREIGRVPARRSRWKARARSTRVSTYLLDADTLFANDTPRSVSAADPSRAPIASGVAPTPSAYASARSRRAVPFSAEVLLTASNRLTPPSANDFRQLTVLRDAVPDWLEHGDEAKKHAGDSCFWV